MAARLQIDVESRAAREFAGLLERQDLRVLDARPSVEAASYDLAIAHQDRAHQRIGTRLRATTPRQIERLAEKSGRPHLASGRSFFEERGDELLRVEGKQIVSLFPDAHIAYGEV